MAEGESIIGATNTSKGAFDNQQSSTESAIDDQVSNTAMAEFVQQQQSEASMKSDVDMKSDALDLGICAAGGVVWSHLIYSTPGLMKVLPVVGIGLTCHKPISDVVNKIKPQF